MNLFRVIYLVIGNKINIILIIRILPLVYAKLATAMAHFAPEMGKMSRASLFSLFAFNL